MRRTVFLAVVISLVSVSVTTADIVHLTDGRKLEGQVTVAGNVVKVVTRMGTVTLPRGRVARIEKKKAAADIYKEKAAAIADGDAEAHYKLALWCKENRLARKRVLELNKAIEIDPDHEKARAALKYVKVDGKWMKAKRGMVYVNGKWMKPEEAVKEGKALYEMEKYEDALKVLTNAAGSLRKNALVAEAQLHAGLCAERLGKWEEAKNAYGAILSLKGKPEERFQAEIRKDIIEGSTGGMYLIKGTHSKEDIFTIDDDDAEETKDLTGLQSLTNPLVMKIALRERCVASIEKGKGLLKKAKDVSDGTKDNDAKAGKLLDEADEQFNKAEHLVEGVARGFLIEVVKLRVGIINNAYGIQSARVQGQLMRLRATRDTKAQMRVAGKLSKEIDALLTPLAKIQKLVQKYPDELSTQLARCKGLRTRLKALKAQLAAFSGS